MPSAGAASFSSLMQADEYFCDEEEPPGHRHGQRTRTESTVQTASWLAEEDAEKRRAEKEAIAARQKARAGSAAKDSSGSTASQVWLAEHIDKKNV